MYRDDCCIILPTYNNGKTLRQVIKDVLELTSHIIVVNDGSTDQTSTVLASFPGIEIVSYPKNRGKGYAIHAGFKKARQLGYHYAITMDTDGQHFATDIPVFWEVIEKNPEALVVGSRSLAQENMPGKNSFANRFSNFWYHLQTLNKLPDTQSGFRLYPIHRMRKMRFFCRRYEAELEMLVRVTWRLIPVIPVKINVYYAPDSERISHFRPFWDFFRISLLNTLFTICAILYFYPKKLVSRFCFSFFGTYTLFPYFCELFRF